MSEVPHYNIVIVTPGSTFTAGYVKSVLMSLHAIHNDGLTWFFLNDYSSHVSIAREATISGPEYQDIRDRRPRHGEFTYDKLVWIDSDIAWRPSDLGRIYHSSKDIISGCYLLGDRSVAVCEFSWDGMMTEEELLTRTEPFKVQGVGFGFVAMKSGVFESIPKPWFGQVQDGGNLLIGEDVAFCMKAKAAGYDIWVDPAVKVGHQKSLIIDWNQIPLQPVVEG